MPVRSAVASAAVGVATLSVAIVFAANLSHLLIFGHVQDLSQVLGIGLAAVALLTTAHLLITSLRRRRDFAILRALGFTSWQVRGIFCRRALTLAGIALVIGVPAGIACGRLC